MTAKAARAKVKVSRAVPASTRKKASRGKGSLEQATAAFREAVDGIVSSVKKVVASGNAKPRARKRRAHV